MLSILMVITTVLDEFWQEGYDFLTEVLDFGPVIITIFVIDIWCFVEGIKIVDHKIENLIKKITKK